jgi:hypothetical protein
MSADTPNRPSPKHGTNPDLGTESEEPRRHRVCLSPDHAHSRTHTVPAPNTDQTIGSGPILRFNDLGGRLLAFPGRSLP